MPGERLGSVEQGGMEKLKGHPFFSDHFYNDKWGHLLKEKSPLEAKLNLSSRPKCESDRLESHPLDQ